MARKPRDHADMKRLLFLLAVMGLAFCPLMVSQAQAAGAKTKTHKAHHQASHQTKHHGKHHKKG
jgi:Ni/Co efflux regulator RcnB